MNMTLIPIVAKRGQQTDFEDENGVRFRITVLPILYNEYYRGYDVTMVRLDEEKKEERL